MFLSGHLTSSLRLGDVFAHLQKASRNPVILLAFVLSPQKKGWGAAPGKEPSCLSKLLLFFPLRLRNTLKYCIIFFPSVLVGSGSSTIVLLNCLKGNS